MRRTPNAGWLLLALLWALNGCRFPGAGAPMPATTMGGQASPVVQVFYATDRAPEERKGAVQTYGEQRSDEGRLALGIAEVSIPPHHKLCAIEEPSIWKLELHPSTDRHMVVLNVRQRSTAAFYEEMRRRTQGSPTKDAFVFVHGYNVSFEDALLRTAQLSHDLGFHGAAIAYSWPSNGKLLSYSADEADAQWTTAHLRWFLEQLVRDSGATSIHLIGHSMGSRPLTEALAAMATHDGPGASPPFRQLVLAASDVDKQTFGQMASQVRAPVTGATLYVASNDLALLASRKLHEYPRLGDTEGGVFVSPGIDSLDATAVNEGDVLGHSGYGDSCPVLADIFSVLLNGTPPEQRFGLEAVTSATGTFYRFRPRVP